MRLPWPALATVALLLGLPAPAGAVPGPRGADAFDGGKPRVQAELLVDAEELRPGQELRVGVLFELDPGWHVYWRNAGESGLPTKLTWDFPKGRVGPIRWPAPEVFEESDGFLTTFGYSDEVLLPARAVVSGSARGRARISVVADFVTCKIGCIPGSIALARELPVGAGRPASREVRERFDRWEERIPVSAESLGLAVEALYSQSAVRPGDAFETALLVRCRDRSRCVGLRLAAADAAQAFLPEQLPTLELSPVAHRARADGGFALVLEGRASSDDPGRPEQRLRGLVPVVLARGGERRYVEVDVPLPRAFAGEPVETVDSPLWAATGGFEPPPAGLTLLDAFALALLGGLILNLMPCVLPVLAIKVFHVAELAHRSRREVLGHGIAYSAGVLTSMGLLALTVLALRAAGMAVGWGFQFQEPIFIAFISTVLVVFALNLFGVFEVSFQPAAAARLGAESTGLHRSFFEGLLAVVLATPCTAPFLGTAVGFAFASSAAVIVAMFLAIGIGLAAPYALVTLVPAWARWIPRPGRWMIQLRRALGFSLVATVVFLLWVMGRSVGVDAQALVLGYLVAVSFGVWGFGLVQQTGRPRAVAGAGLAGVALVAFGLGLLPLNPPVEADPPPGLATGAPERPPAWAPWDPAAIQDQLARGRAVFVDFTADWCITCKVNESVVLEDPRVQSELERLGVATFKADWTLYDDEIRRVLASFGKAGVPMYLVYRPDAPADPAVLPELLTVDLVVDALRDAATDPGAAAMNVPPEQRARPRSRGSEEERS